MTHFASRRPQVCGLARVGFNLKHVVALVAELVEGESIV